MEQAAVYITPSNLAQLLAEASFSDDQRRAINRAIIQSQEQQKASKAPVVRLVSGGSWHE